MRLRQAARSQGDGELRAYLPGVVCKLATAIARYENAARVLTPTLVDRVLALYFTDDFEFDRSGTPRQFDVEVPEFSPEQGGPGDPDGESSVLPPPYEGPFVAPAADPDAAIIASGLLASR